MFAIWMMAIALGGFVGRVIIGGILTLRWRGVDGIETVSTDSPWTLKTTPKTSRRLKAVRPHRRVLAGTITEKMRRVADFRETVVSMTDPVLVLTNG